MCLSVNKKTADQILMTRYGMVGPIDKTLSDLDPGQGHKRSKIKIVFAKIPFEITVTETRGKN